MARIGMMRASAVQRIRCMHRMVRFMFPSVLPPPFGV
jgi:hypothetical protein